MNKKAQVTIFVIAAIVIIALVALVFLLRTEKIPFIPGKTETNPRAFMGSCIEEQMRENINKVLSQGGFIEPQNYKMFSDTKVAYLCYHRGSFEPCINQHPMFLTEISSGLKNSISLVIEECFDEFKSSLEKQGYEVEFGESIESEVSLSTGSVYLDIIRDITVTKSGESTNYKDMRLTYLSSLYELAGIANQIANGEAKYCHFEFMGYTNLYPEYLILVKTMSDSTKVYSIISKKTEEQMNIAIRGCAPL